MNSVQLVTVVKNSYIKKYSMKAVLAPLVEDLKKLVQFSFADLCLHF